MKKICFILVACLSACGVGHPSGVDKTIRAGIEALNNSDCEAFIKLWSPFEEQVTLETCTENLIRQNNRVKIKLLFEYALNAKGEMDESQTIYTIDLSETKSEKSGELSLIYVNGVWYLRE